MFIEEEDWSDDQDAQILSRAVLKNVQRNVKNSTHLKPKVVGKKSLMRTLQTLGSVPDWKSEERQHDSDSETEAAPSSSKRKKRKKKRKRAGTTEQPENGELDQTPAEEKTSTKEKDKKFGKQKVKNNCVGETEVKGKDKPVNATVNKAEDTEKLSRKQWKNKMKNKKNCKNKYRPDKKPEEKVKNAESTEEGKQNKEVKTDSQNNNNNNKNEKNSQTSAKKKEKEPKAEKRKETEEDAKVPGATETQTHREEKGSKAGKDATGLKQKFDEPKGEFTEESEAPPKRPKLELSREQSLKRETLRKILYSTRSDHQGSPAEQKEEPPTPEPEPEVKLDRSASLRSRMEQRLESARFRYINEVLYSTTSGEARRMFQQDPEAFGIYHRGYTAQVQRWPNNPVNAIIAFIKQKPASLVVADFGCGDCKIARSVRNRVHSFDLASTCELVTVCDMANVPLPNRSVDIAVFCLSLMGTNLSDFLAEANRVLKMGGILKIAEVASRFENVRNFITGLANLGFKLVTKDTENTHFYSFESVKTGDVPANIKKFGLQLLPCIYKKR